jgi:hypothetical protein
MMVAVLHVVGALVVTVGFWAVVFVLFEVLDKGRKKRFVQDISIALGVPESSLERPEIAPKLIEYMSTRFSSELFRNRLSDLCDTLIKAWHWVGFAIQVVTVGFVGLKLFTEGSEDAPVMWLVPVTAVFFTGAAATVALLCQALTGRYPGEAKRGRNALACLIEGANWRWLATTG